MKPALSFVESISNGAGNILKASFDKPLQVQYKGENDLVTEADLKAEAFLLAAIQDEFPEHRVLAEESGVRDGNAEHLWYIDPLDGTLNYAHGVPIYSVSVAYAWEGEVQLGVVFNPQTGECYSAQRGRGAHLNGSPIKVSDVKDLDRALLLTGFPHDVRRNPANNLDHFGAFMLLSQGVSRLGSAALDLCNVAAGRFDGYWEMRLNPWDIAAGGLIVEEAGGIVTTLSGDQQYLSAPCSILAANPHLHPQMRAKF
jgi:myo-inositol-1(or 4)-monophosphatase